MRGLLGTCSRWHFEDPFQLVHGFLLVGSCWLFHVDRKHAPCGFDLEGPIDSRSWIDLYIAVEGRNTHSSQQTHHQMFV